MTSHIYQNTALLNKSDWSHLLKAVRRDPYACPISDIESERFVRPSLDQLDAAVCLWDNVHVNDGWHTPEVLGSADLQAWHRRLRCHQPGDDRVLLAGHSAETIQLQDRLTWKHKGVYLIRVEELKVSVDLCWHNSTPKMGNVFTNWLWLISFLLMKLMWCIWKHGTNWLNIYRGNCPTMGLCCKRLINSLEWHIATIAEMKNALYLIPTILN